MADPILSIFPLETFDVNLMAIKDISVYPQGYAPVSPFLKVEVPSVGIKNVVFKPNDINVLNSTILGLTKSNTPLIALPDGVYTFTYSINPAYKYNITKSILRVDKLYKKFNDTFLSIQSTCDAQLGRNQRIQLSEIEWYIQGAIASANNCSGVQAMELYKKASDLINKLSEKCSN